MMTLMEAIRARRSIRKFKPDDVPENIILQLLEYARLAPSSYNSQPWRFIVLKDRHIKVKLRECAYGLHFIESAPCIIVCCVDLNTHRRGAVRRCFGELMSIGVLDDIGETSYIAPELLGDDSNSNQYLGECEFDSAIATEHIALGAVALGLGTCWVHMFQRDKVHELLNLPQTTAVVSLMALGYPDQSPPPRPRLPLKDIVLSPVPEACFSTVSQKPEGEIV